ncbi:hypothetical protein Y032_0024g1026 [Ancylostoma ceylanicum]|uniref:Uncharacterized protein n=1 Tax=Ancylostoma ceylanicum TaxID=53326 RepID=A0A016UXX6_9BILA|nr:hypothetical protein Y032_0024g1026 [Ancylostoma ceylanicum]
MKVHLRTPSLGNVHRLIAERKTLTVLKRLIYSITVAHSWFYGISFRAFSSDNVRGTTSPGRPSFPALHEMRTRKCSIQEKWLIGE